MKLLLTLTAFGMAVAFVAGDGSSSVSSYPGRVVALSELDNVVAAVCGRYTTLQNDCTGSQLCSGTEFSCGGYCGTCTGETNMVCSGTSMLNGWDCTEHTEPCCAISSKCQWSSVNQICACSGWSWSDSDVGVLKYTMELESAECEPAGGGT